LTVITAPPPLRAAPAAPVWRGQWRPADFSLDHSEASICTLCPHRCELAEGEAGLCAVRRRRNGRLETAAFSTVAQHWGPVERKPLYHYRPGLMVLTLAPPGCTMGCLYCQNHKVSQVGRSATAIDTATEVDAAAIMAMASDRGAAVGLSYTEPTLGAELTLALAASGDAPLIWKTNGFISSGALGRIAPHLAAVNVDLKSADTRTHERLTGCKLASVLETIETLLASGCWVEISTPLISGYNDSSDQIRNLAIRVAAIDKNIPWHLGRVTPDHRLRSIDPTTPLTLAEAREQARSHGLRNVYIERAFGDEGRATHCPACGNTVVTRGIWKTNGMDLADGECGKCAAKIPGVWNSNAKRKAARSE
jgi:pyruvate formate lyase activating enzyme